MTVYNYIFDPEIWKQVNQESKDLLEDFMLELRQRKRSAGTIYQYRADLKGFLCYVFRNFANRSVLELGKKDFRRFALYLVDERGVSNARHNRVIAAIRSMLDFAEQDDDLSYENNAARKVKGLGKSPVKEIIFLSDELVLGMYKKLTEKGDLQKAALLMLAYDSAGRKAELAQVEKHSFLYPSRNNTNKVVGKGKKVFPLLYFSGTTAAVTAWLRQRGEDTIDSLWVVGQGAERRAATSENLYQWVTEMRVHLSELQGHEIDFNPHSMRHSALANYSDGTHYVCRELGKAGFPIEKLRLIAHHDKVDTTQHYLPDTSQDELETMFGIKMVTV